LPARTCASQPPAGCTRITGHGRPRRAELAQTRSWQPALPHAISPAHSSAPRERARRSAAPAAAATSAPGGRRSAAPSRTTTSSAKPPPRVTAHTCAWRPRCDHMRPCSCWSTRAPEGPRAAHACDSSETCMFLQQGGGKRFPAHPCNTPSAAQQCTPVPECCLAFALRPPPQPHKRHESAATKGLLRLLRCLCSDSSLAGQRHMHLVTTGVTSRAAPLADRTVRTF